MSVDLDGDGIEDQLVQPVSLQENPTDFVPPAKIENLTLETNNPGTVTLSWTASGDDGDIG